MSDQLDTTRTPAPVDDSGCLRWVMAVPLTILYTIAALCCYAALTIRPSGSWDRDAYGAIALASWLTVTAGVLGLLLTVVPPTVRRATGPWWLAPPLILSTIVVVRWALST
ncbi:hypothetical protein ACWEF9_08340 [Streptomyces sp. NPDC004980]